MRGISMIAEWPLYLGITDWSGFVHFRPDLYFRPASLPELAAFLSGVERGQLPRQPMRVLGSLHSCADICVAPTIIDVSKIPRWLDYSSADRTVAASANWSLHDVLIELSKYGRSLTATGGTDPQSLAGVISTNTAPATSKYSLYDTLQAVTILRIDPVTGTATERTITREEPSFAGVVGSLGAIGVVVAVKFGTIEEPHFETVQRIVPISDVLEDVEKTSARYDFWRIDWLPDSKKGLLWAATRIPASKSDPSGDYPADKAIGVLKWVFGSISKLEKDKGGPLLSRKLRAVYKVLARTYGETKAKGPLRNMLPVDRTVPLRVAMSEWAFAPQDLQRVLRHCRSYFKKNGWPNLPIEIELAKTDSFLMSPWNWPGLDYVIKFNFMYLMDICRTPESRGELLGHIRGLWDSMRSSGIPFKAHWGKINFIDPEFARSEYQLERFKPLVQPAFVNDYLRERFGSERLD